MAGIFKKRPPIFEIVSVLTSEPNMQRVQKTLTNAEVLSLFSSPVQILPPPGLGKFYVPWLITIMLHPGATPFTLGAASNFFLETPGGDNLSQSLPINGFDNPQPRISNYLCQPTNPNEANTDNQPLDITNDGADMTDGDGFATVIIYYSTETYV